MSEMLTPPDVNKPRLSPTEKVIILAGVTDFPTKVLCYRGCSERGCNSKDGFADTQCLLLLINKVNAHLFVPILHIKSLKKTKYLYKKLIYIQESTVIYTKQTLRHSCKQNLKNHIKTPQ